MIYRLPCINDEKLLREYVREHHDHGETRITASLGLASSDYSEWVEKIQRNALTGDEAWGKSLLYADIMRSGNRTDQETFPWDAWKRTC